MNRSTIYQYFSRDSKLEHRRHQAGRGNYPVFRVPWDWEYSFLLINSMKITDFQAVVLYSTELVIRFWVNDECQVNIPYKDIEYIEVREFINVGYMGLYKNEKIQY